MKVHILSQKTVRKIKRAFAIFMLPLFILQMVSANLLFMAVPQAHAEDELVAVEASKPVTKEALPDDVDEKAPIKEKEVIETAATEMEVVKEESAASTTVVETEKTASPETTTEAPVTTDEQPVVDVQSVVDPISTEPVVDVQSVVDPIPTEPAIDPVAASIEKPVTQEVKPLWISEGEKATTGEAVELGKTYVAMQNDQVTVTFTKLPENPGTLSIEEVKLSDEQVKEFGALSNKAYDITSTMENGTFKYDLTLPIPKDEQNVQIKFAEDIAGLDQAEAVSENDVEMKSEKANITLDHFTIFFAGTSQAATLPVPSNVATLSNLTVNGTTVPGFSSNALWYLLYLSNPAVDYVNQVIAPTTTDPAAIFTTTNTSTMATVVVTAQDGVTKRTYTIQWAPLGAGNIVVGPRKTITMSPGETLQLVANTYGTAAGSTITWSLNYSNPSNPVENSMLSVSPTGLVTIFPTTPSSAPDRYIVKATTSTGIFSYAWITVKVPASTTTLVSDLNPSVYGDNVNIAATVTGSIVGVVPTGTVTFKEGSVVLGVVDLIGGTATLTNLSAGTHNITAEYGGGNFANSTSATLVQNVTKKPLIITAKDQTKKYGDIMFFTGVEVMLDGLVSGSGDNVASVTLASAGEPANAAVGTYPIIASTAVGTGLDNYNITYVSGSLVVFQQAITVTADAQSKAYGDADPNLTFTSDSLVNGDTFTGSLSRALGEDVGTYAITQGTLSAGTNYDLTFVGADFVINKKDVTITADNKSLKFGDPDPAFTFTAAGLVGGENISVFDTAPTCSVAGAHAAVGTYPIVCSGGVDNNYNFVSYIDGMLTVADTIFPTISTLSFANRQGIVTNGNVIDINLAGVTQSDLDALGVITVSENSVLQITSPMVSQAISLNSGSNDIGISQLFEFPFPITPQAILDVAANFPDGTISATGTLTKLNGNETSITINIATIDNEKPIVTLIGGNVTMKERRTYVEAGATWTDNVDGSGTVTSITSDLNTRRPGTYTITYSYTDLAGNSGFAQRVVKVTNVSRNNNDDDNNNNDDDTAEFVSIITGAVGDNIFGTPSAEDSQDTQTADSQGVVQGAQTSKDEPEIATNGASSSNPWIPWSIGGLGFGALALIGLKLFSKKTLS